MDRPKFIEEYASHLRDGQAALFVGAGLSMRAGYPSWRELLKDIAAELDLDLEREPDLPGLVQFHLNHVNKTRNTLIKTIEDHFLPEKAIPQALRTLARLPIRHVWTTNYDRLIERAWLAAHKRIDEKLEDDDLRREIPYAHAVLYKMHGSVTKPSKVIIAKGDYEFYRQSHRAFVQHLTSQLAARRFLFLGFSFTDPNLANLFALMRETYGESPPDSYTIVRRPQMGTGRGSKEKHEYDMRRHALWVKDLVNYGIQCVEVEAWSELDDILEQLERRLRVNDVLVSGSYPEQTPPGIPAERKRITDVARDIGRLLGKRRARLVSGFGLTVGSASVAGLLDYLYEGSQPNLEESLYLRPFPQTAPQSMSKDEFQRLYREDMVSRSGAVIYIGGVSVDGHPPKLVPASGVKQEFEIAARLGRFPIPVGATGGAAAEIWHTIDDEYARYVNGLPRPLFDALNDSAATPAKLVQAVEAALEWLSARDAGAPRSPSAKSKTRK